MDEEEQDDSWGKDFVREPSYVHRHTLFWFHSCYGQPRHVEAFLQEMEEQGLSFDTVRVVAPCAPARHCEGWGDCLQWFEYQTDVLQFGKGSQDDADATQLREERERLLELTTQEVRKLPRGGGLVLSGLSQGVSVMLDLLLHMPPSLRCYVRGALFKRGMLQRESLTPRPRPNCLSGLWILATHGDEDEMIPLPAARSSYELVKDFGPRFQLRTFRGLMHRGHCAAEDAAMAGFLRSCLQLGWGHNHASS